MIDKKTKVGIFGGSFNPPTFAHLFMASEIINSGKIDEIWFVPCGDRDDKKLVSCEHRINMLKLAIASVFKSLSIIKINDIEMKNKKMIPTYELMQLFINNYDHEFYFIIGSDLINSIEKWHYGLKLKNEINFIILERFGYKINMNNLPKKYIIIQNAMDESSSTQIRERLNEFNEKFKIHKYISDFNKLYLTIFGLVPSSIISYIKDNNLYFD